MVQDSRIGVRTALIGLALMGFCVIGRAAADTITETEPNDTPATANPTYGANGVTIIGTLSSSTDHDFFSFVVSEPGVRNPPFSTGAEIAFSFSPHDYHLTVIAPSGRTIASGNYVGPYIVGFESSEIGTYIVEIAATSLSSVGSYQLSILGVADGGGRPPLIVGSGSINGPAGGPFVYVTNPNVLPGTVSVIDTATNAVLDPPITVGTRPAAIAVNPAGTRLYVANQESNTVSVIDIATNAVVGAPIAVGASPGAIAVNPDGTRVYVANGGSNTVSVIDAATNAVVGAPILVGRSPSAIAVKPDGTRIYVANVANPNSYATNPVSVIDTATNTVIKEIAVGAGPSAIVVNPAGTRLYVLNTYDYNVSVIDTTTNAVIGAPIAVGAYPEGMAINPAGTRLYVTNAHSDSVSVIDTGTNAVVSTIALIKGDNPVGVVVDQTGTRVYVANYGNFTMSVIDTATNAVIGAPIWVGPYPFAIIGPIGAAVPSYEGLWWAAPAGSESGWGINFAHQGDVIFATWFTYDAAGKAWWLSMTASRIAEGLHSGTLYQTTGAPFNAFVPPATTTPVGSATLTLSRAGTGTFAYTVNGVSHSKAIVRQAFGPLPTCTWGAQPDLTKATNYQDLWWAAPAGSESGWGVNLTHQGTTIFATWFTYDVNRNPLWYSVTAAQTGPKTYTGTLYRTTGPAFNALPFNPNLVVRTAVGTATFSFSDGNTGSFAYQVNDGANVGTQSKAITRQVFRTPGTVCQ